MLKLSAKPRAFDERYYRRWYADSATRSGMDRFTPIVARMVAGQLAYFGLEVRSILDVGCGLGYWRGAAARYFPGARYHGIDVSDYACRRFGWERASIVDYDPGHSFDLVVCQSVLQYLPNRDCEAAIANLARLCDTALYLEAPTRRDLAEVCVKGRTDTRVYGRSGDWYRRRLRPHFVGIGGGLYLSRNVDAYPFELAAQWL